MRERNTGFRICLGTDRRMEIGSFVGNRQRSGRKYDFYHGQLVPRVCWIGSSVVPFPGAKSFAVDVAAGTVDLIGAELLKALKNSAGKNLQDRELKQAVEDVFNPPNPLNPLPDGGITPPDEK